MGLHTKLCIVLLGTCLSSFLLRHECKKLDGYEFPVYSTEFCPRNQEEWNLRSSAINCTNTNGYMCLPNDNLTELLEFCYIYPRMLIQKDLCLYLVKRYSRVNSHNCSNFKYGCPENNYFSSAIYQYPSCIHVENGCFFAEPSCKSKTTTYAPQTTNFKQTGNIQENTTVTFYHESTEQIQNENDRDGIVLVATLYGVLLFIVFFCSLCIYFRIKKKSRICKRRSEIERYEKEMVAFEYECGEPTSIYKEYLIEKSIFNQWEQDDFNFISTNACEEAEKRIKSMNLVIVAGHSGSGKSAIIQHIALKYRKQGWTVKRVKEVKDIVDEYASSRFQKNKTMCVFNDPLGKDSFDEILNNSWQTYEEEVKLYLKTAKLVMSSRNHIIYDTRLTRYLVNQSDIIDIDNEEYKLSVNEKRQIFIKYTSDMNLSDEECGKLVEVKMLFPSLCKLYSSNEAYKNKGIRFFTEPVTVLKEAILGFRKKDKGKYCALALLVFFNNDLCVSDLLKNKDTKYKFKQTLKLCGLPEDTPPSAIENSLNSLKDFFVKKVGDTYHFYQDFVMEVTTHVLGNDYPAEIIKYIDIGFFRKTVRLGNCEEHVDPFTFYLSDRYIEELGERLFTELFGERLIDVVLNPCLRNEKVIKVLQQKMADYPENLQMLIKPKTHAFDKQELDWISKSLLFSKIKFLELENEVSPLFALIVFRHTQLSQYCVNILQQKQVDITRCFLISAMCCNGSIELFNTALKDHAEESLKKAWGRLCPTHIVSVFHNYELLRELIKIGVDVNQKTDDHRGWTPLMLAASNDTQECRDNYHKESGATRRDKTVQLLVSNGANINLCTENGASPLYIACQNGHDSTVQLLLSYGADMNILMADGTSPLTAACYEEHKSTVHLLLRSGADTNLCDEEGSSPLYIACQSGHDSTVQLLLSYEADSNLCRRDGASPLYIACQSGHDSIVQLLLSNGAKINLRKRNGPSPFCIACENGHDRTAKLLLRKGADINLCKENGASPLYIACQNGHDSTVQLLLSNGANINLCKEDGASPLYIACQNGHDSTVQLLLRKGADINFCKENGASPLYIACQNGYDSTVQLLLTCGADINLCKEDGASPLYKACQIGHVSTVQLLLTYGADINFCKENGASPLHTACQNGYDSTVQLLLTYGADINFCKEDGASPLYKACQNGHDSTVQLLLSNGADINLCDEEGNSPLYIAGKNGHDSTVQLLLSNEAYINLCEENESSPLYKACQNGHASILNILLSKGAHINLSDKEGISPLYTACRNGQYSTVQLLLGNGADINLCEENGASPLYIACQNGHDITVLLLLRNGADINLCEENGASPLYIACQNGHDRTVLLLLRNGADINLRKRDGASPIYIACQNGHDTTVQHLLSNGANINLCKEDGASPLYIACQDGHDSTVQLLLSNGAQINLCKKNSTSPLYTACKNGHDSTVPLLLNNGADINLCKEDGSSPLYIACRNKQFFIVLFLLLNKADINLCKEDGASPLTAACHNGQDRTVRLLLRKGADINLCKKNGTSPLYIACENGHDSTVEILLRNGADINLCMKNGASPLSIAGQNGHDSTVQLLLSNRK